MRQHSLFPILDYIARSEYKHDSTLNKLKSDVADVKKDVIDLKETMNELHSLMEKVSNVSFDLERSGYKVWA